MQLNFTFSFLLAGLFVALQVVDAAPIPKRAPGLVHLPLTRVEQRGADVHPQVYLQQHINRGLRRLALMTGRSIPSSEELSSHLAKRVVAIEQAGGLVKRFNRVGISQKHSPANNIATSESPVSKSPKKGNGNSLKKGKNGANTGNGAASGNSGSASANVTSDVTFANTPTTGDSLGLDIESTDVGYLATVQMGTPPQNFLLLMDSGSADLWVGSENCQSQGGGGCGNHNFLGTTSSSTFQDTAAPFSVTYGTGQVSGDIITDNLVVAGLALNAHTFGVATTESVDFSSDTTPFDGLMGLAQSTLSQQNTATPVEALASAGLVAEAITSYKIPRLADDKNDGEITFGGLDQTKFKAATLTTVPNVNAQGFWEAALDSVAVNGKDLGLQGRTAILDTGTTLLIAPAADVATIHAAIPGSKSDGQGGFTIPCTTTASVALTFGGTSFAIDPRDIAFQPVNAANPTGDCTSGIAAGNIGGATEWLVGDVFLKNAYFSTNVGKNTVSLAQLA